MGNLVIVESPAKAKTIQKYLGEGYVVKPSFGHIRDLQDKNLSIEVEDGFKPLYIVPADKKKVVADLKAAASKADIVWLASDEDREGEAISWHLVETLELDPAKTKRIAFHEITKTAILEAIQNPRELDMDLVNAQQARRVLDRLVGFELSPILWRRIQRGLSAGRVQSVALRLVVDREREIAAFVPEQYYRIEARFLVHGVKVKALLDRKFLTIEEARQFLQDSIGALYSVDSIDRREGTRFPAPPFITSTLQQEASRKLHFPVSLTMRLAQGLYERGLITYMRTDSTNLSSLAVNTAKQFICDNFGPEYSHPRQFKTKAKGAQEAHEAIRPTFISNPEIEGTAQEKKIYELIWKRTVASQMAEANVMNTTIKVGQDHRSELYSMQTSEILFDGFLKLYMEGSDDAPEEEMGVVLPEMHIGDVLTEKGINADCKFTQPPYRYSEATLVKKLEELGIGRPSTYAATVGTLTTGRGYIVKGDKEGRKVEVTSLSLKGNTISSAVKTETIGAEKGKLLPQDIGLMVTDYLVENFADIMGYDFTANVEKDFDSIASGNKQWAGVISDFYGPFHSKVDEALSDHEYRHLERELGTDPSDGKLIVAKFGQYGPYVQKGEGEDRQFATLQKGQLIESITLEEALALFSLPRKVGQMDGVDIIAAKGRYGAYLKYGDTNVSLPRGVDPLTVGVEQASAIIREAVAKAGTTDIIKEFAGGLQLRAGRYGPYLKLDGSNYKLPKGCDVEALTEADCRKIIAESSPTSSSSRTKYRKFKKTK